MELSTGEVARAVGVSEKTVRLYADRGLVNVRRSDAGVRLFDAGALQGVRRIVALRRIDLSLADISKVLTTADPVARFDEVWGGRRARFVDLVAEGERARDALAEAGVGTDGAGMQPLTFRERSGHLRLSVEVIADLRGLPDGIRDATAVLFATLRAAEVALVDHPYVEYPGRVTRTQSGRVLVHVPIAAPVAPEGAQSVTYRAACMEAVVELDALQATDQGVIVAAHDLLSRRRFADAVATTGSTREVYFPSFGMPDAEGTVMEICVPIEPPSSAD